MFDPSSEVTDSKTASSDESETDAQDESETDSERVRWKSHDDVSSSESEAYRCIETAPTICPECGGNSRSNEKHGEVFCEDCGVVITEDSVDYGPDWRGGDEDEDVDRRAGTPLTPMIHDNGLSTVFNPYEQDPNGNTIPHAKQKRLQRMETWNERYSTKDNTDRNLKRALGELQRMSSALEIPDDITETASVLYREMVNEDLLLGQSIESMTTASLYIAARKHDNPRPIDDFIMVSQVSAPHVERAYRHTIRNLDLQLEPARPEQYVNQILSDIEDSITNRQLVEELTNEMLDNAREEQLLNGKNPVACSAGAVYAACLVTEQDVTQTDVSDSAKLSNVTIRNRYRDFLRASSII